MTSLGGLEVSIYIHVKERLAPRTSCKGNVSSINANIIIVFLGYKCQKTISMNNTFWECRSKVNITGLLSDLGTLTATTLSIVGLSRWNKNWNVRNSYSYVATVTKIRFHFAALKILRFLLKTHCRHRGWWYHVPHSSLVNASVDMHIECTESYITDSGSMTILIYFRFHFCVFMCMQMTKGRFDDFEIDV